MSDSNALRDPYNLERFIDAQRPVFDQVLCELREGRKRSHWMWFIFPQLRGLSGSDLGKRFAISSAAEAQAYLEHPLLGARLAECTRLVTAVERRSIEAIFGHPDDLKFRSCMTLFASFAGVDSLFHQALAQYFAGEPDRVTLELLRSG